MNADPHHWVKDECLRMVNEMRDAANSTYAQDTITIARLRDENLAKLRRIEDMRLELLKLELEIKRGNLLASDVLATRLETIRGEPA